MANKEGGCCCCSFFIWVVGYLALVAGVVSPYWYQVEASAALGLVNGRVVTGIFYTCVEADATIVVERECGFHGIGDLDGWWKTSAIMMCAALVLAKFALFTACFIPVSATLQMLAGAVGIGGATLYITNIKGSESAEIIAKILGVECGIQWGFIVAIAGSVILLLNGVGLAAVSGSNGCSMSPVCCCCCNGSDGQRNPGQILAVSLPGVSLILPQQQTPYVPLEEAPYDPTQVVYQHSVPTQNVPV